MSGRSIRSSQYLKQNVEKYYGVQLRTVGLLSCYWPYSKGLNAMLGLFSAFHYFRLRTKKWHPDIIVARNLYAAFLLRPFIAERLFFETHQLEHGWRKYLQGKLVQDRHVHTIVISQALKRILKERVGCTGFNPMVLHDAAPSGVLYLSPEEKVKRRAALFDKKVVDGAFKKIAGYFGHLYSGRGVDMIRALARRHPDIAFMIFGGNEEQIGALKKTDHDDNFMVMGYVEPNEVMDVMGIMDILMMPYQNNVSIGDNRSNTSPLMSPMKMFEYMACGVPIVASDLPSLKEVLVDRHNCLLAIPHDVDAWSRCLDCLCNDDDFARRLGMTAHNEYNEKYNWNVRASKIVKMIGGS